MSGPIPSSLRGGAPHAAHHHALRAALDVNELVEGAFAYAFAICDYLGLAEGSG